MPADRRLAGVLLYCPSRSPPPTPAQTKLDYNQNISLSTSNKHRRDLMKYIILIHRAMENETTTK
jgi:hypothetical protein